MRRRRPAAVDHVYSRARAAAWAPSWAASGGLVRICSVYARTPRVAPLDQEPGPPVVDQRAQATDRRGHHGRPAGGGLERHQPERLAAARHEHHVGRPVVGRQHVVRLRGGEADAVADAQGGGELLDALDLGTAVGAAGAAHDDQDGRGIVQLGQRPDGDAQPLERLDAADEEQHRPVTWVDLRQRRARLRGRRARRRRGSPRAARSRCGPGRRRRGARAAPPRRRSWPGSRRSTR